MTAPPSSLEALRFRAAEDAAGLDPREAAARAFARVQDLDPGAYRRRAIRCALLDEQERCLVYAVRPLVCRVHTSTDVDACKDVDAGIPLDPWLVKVGAALIQGLGGGGRTELHAALRSAWNGRRGP